MHTQQYTRTAWVTLMGKITAAWEPKILIQRRLKINGKWVVSDVLSSFTSLTLKKQNAFLNFTDLCSAQHSNIFAHMEIFCRLSFCCISIFFSHQTLIKNVLAYLIEC